MTGLESTMNDRQASPRHEKAVFGGGCFWCTEAVFKELDGVERVQSGYAGGHVDNPDYRQVCEGGTGHIEVIEIDFDPERIDYDTLLDVFFATHDPTTRDRQGNDVGEQYRSAIFWQNQAQREAAEAKLAELAREQVFDAPVVTELRGPAKVWPAESYHDDYYARNPGQGYCHYVISPKLAKFRQRYARLLRA
jgi:peptide-methionine (S)-S-oxide reductase